MLYNIDIQYFMYFVWKKVVRQRVFMLKINTLKINNLHSENHQF